MTIAPEGIPVESGLLHSAASLAGKRMAFGRRVDAETFREYTRLVPLLESAMAQISRGPLKLDGSVAFVGDVVFARNRFNVQYSAQVVPEPHYVALMFPLSWQRDYVFNGVSATPSTMFISSRPDGYVTRSQHNHSISVGVPRALLSSALAARIGIHPEEVRIVDGAFHLDAQRSSVLRRNVFAYHDLIMAPSAAHRNDAFWLDLRDTLVAELAAAYASRRSDLERGRTPYPTSLEVVQRTFARCRGAGGAPVSLDDFAEACGVGPTCINQAFHRICGASPGKLFRLRRLVRARELLLESGPRRSAVKAAALRSGFVDLSRFSRDYARLFGQLPSETVGR